MTGSLYTISEELRNIFNSVIENDGEITEEQYNSLIITQENFKEKIEDYCKAIAMTKYEVDGCKCEKKRINDNQQVKVNLIEKLKSRLLDAVLEFGDDKVGKNGVTKTLDAGTFKLFTKNLIKFVAEEYRTNLLRDTLLSYFKELFINKVLVVDDYAEKTISEEDEVSGMLGAVNAIAKSRFITDLENGVTPIYLTEWTDFTIDDLKALSLTFTFNVNAYDLITDGTYLAQAYCNEFAFREITTEVKPMFEAENITIGSNQTNVSLTIK